MRGTPIVLPVRFSLEGRAVQTTTRELSTSGLFARCLVSPRKGAGVSLQLYLPGVAIAERLTGRVREVIEGRDPGFWADFVAPSSESLARIDLLLTGRQPPAEKVAVGQIDLVPKPPVETAPTRAEGANRRAFPRYEARFAVRFATVEDFVLEYAANISAGGVFVTTGAPPEMDSVVEVEMELPGGGPPVRCRAIVVHRVTAEEAQERGTSPGVGVQFVEADDAFRQSIDAAIEFILAKDKDAP